MLQRLTYATAVGGAMLTGAPQPAYAGVIEFTDRDAWFAAVGPVTTITFTEFPNNTFITDQYQEQGVLFLDGDDIIRCCSGIVYPNDGAGLDGNHSIHLLFLEPQAYLAVDFPGRIIIQLIADGNIFYESPLFGMGGSGLFAGLLSDVLFDEALLFDLDENVALDDLHFGVPSPGGLAVLALAGLSVPRRRRS